MISSKLKSEIACVCFDDSEPRRLEVKKYTSHKEQIASYDDESNHPMLFDDSVPPLTPRDTRESSLSRDENGNEISTARVKELKEQQKKWRANRKARNAGN